jgi:hypothetical protein
MFYTMPLSGKTLLSNYVDSNEKIILPSRESNKNQNSRKIPNDSVGISSKISENGAIKVPKNPQKRRKSAL